MRHSGPRPAHHRDRRRSDASPATRPLLRQAAHGPQAKIPGHDNSVGSRNAMGWSRASSATRQATAPGASTAPCLSDTVTPVGSKSPSPESAVWVDGFKSAEPPISVGNRGATAFMTFRPATRVAMPFSSRGRPEYPYPTHPAIRRAWPGQTPSPDRETRGRMLKFYRSTPSRPTFRARLPCESVRLPSRECKIVARSASLDSASLTAPHRRPRATHAIHNCPACRASHNLYGSVPE